MAQVYGNETRKSIVDYALPSTKYYKYPFCRQNADVCPTPAPIARNSSQNGHLAYIIEQKKEASAGSGGTAFDALAGGGNQSFLTVPEGEAWGKDSPSSTHYNINSPKVYSQLEGAVLLL